MIGTINSLVSKVVGKVSGPLHSWGSKPSKKAKASKCKKGKCCKKCRC